MDWSNLIAGAVIGFLVSIIANLYTDKYKDWIARRTINTKNKRVEQLKKDLERFSKFKNEPTKFYMMIVRRIFIALLDIQLLIFGTFYVLGRSIFNGTDMFLKEKIFFWPVFPSSLQVYLDIFSITLLVGVFLLGYYNFDSAIKDINTYVNFDDFKKSVNDRIKKLS